MGVESETDLFGLLADETRAAIVAELAAEVRETPGDPTLSFSDLRERVGRRDAGNFDYHLKKLRGRFVTRTEAGYRLTKAGVRVAATLAAARPGEGIERPVDDDCPFCGGALVLRHESGIVDVACPDGHEFTFVVPDHVTADRQPDEAVRAIGALARQQIRLMSDGTCALCYGRLPLALEPPVDGDLPLAFLLKGSCAGCGGHVGLPPGAAAVDEPRVRTFYAESGVDAASRPGWDHPLLRASAHAFETDPPRAIVTDRRGDETLRVVVTADGSVASVDVS